MWYTVNCCAPPLPLDVAVSDIKQLKARVEDVSQRNIRYNNLLILHGSDNNKQQQSAVTVVIPPAEQPPGCHHLPILGGVRHPTRCVGGYWDVAQAQQHAV